LSGYLDTPKIYNDPIISRRRKGTNIDPFEKIVESITVENHYVLLSEIPNRYNRVKVTIPNVNQDLFEIEKEVGILRENDYRVDYVNGLVYFHESLIGKTLDFEYTGEGVFLFPDSRVYHTANKDFPNLRDKIIDIDREILVERRRIDTQLLKHPQPSEVIDMRIDRNGKVFNVAKNRIDAEQKKSEDAYVDAKGKWVESIKARIDSLQFVQEEIIDDQARENEKIWSDIRLIPGQITLETGKVLEILNKEVRRLQSQIDMTPEQISLSVKEMREWADGRFEQSSSQIKLLSDQINLKVDVNGIISSINLSKEGIRLQGKLIHLSGQSKIDNAVIKSANIESLSADKIRTGTLRSQNSNTTWNLNTGTLEMKNAHFKLGGGANIELLDYGNRIIYKQRDPQTGKDYFSGLGVGRNINIRFPYAFLGTSTDGGLNAMDSQDFTGFITNTEARTKVDNIGNSVVGDKFQIRDKAVSFKYGWSFDLSSKTKKIIPMSTNVTGINYDIGTYNRRFRDIYVSRIRNNGTVNIRDSRSSRTSGWLIQTGYSGDGSAITLRGLNGHKYNYSLGGRQSNSQRISRIFLKNKPNVSSDKRLKDDFSEVGLGLDFILDLKPTSFKFKKTQADLEDNKHEFGFIAQEVEEAMLKHNKSIDKYSLLSIDDDGFYAMEHEQLIAPMVNSIQELNSNIKEENKKLKNRVSYLEKEVQSLKERIIQ